MDDGSGLKLTVAKYLTPAHYDISRRYDPTQKLHWKTEDPWFTRRNKLLEFCTDLSLEQPLTPDGMYDSGFFCRGGLEPDKACHDYPHGQASLDECIKEALEMLAEQETPDHAPSAGSLPYRWLPLTERRFWATGSY